MTVINEAILQQKVENLELELEQTKDAVATAYNKGLIASREFDESMDSFLIKFLKKDYSSIVVFAVALGLVLVGGVIGHYL